MLDCTQSILIINQLLIIWKGTEVSFVRVLNFPILFCLFLSSFFSFVFLTSPPMQHPLSLQCSGTYLDESLIEPGSSVSFKI